MTPRREVRLWGVNYYAPFNHELCHLAGWGGITALPFDRDIAHFKKLGVSLCDAPVRREIADTDGKLVDNDHSGC